MPEIMSDLKERIASAIRQKLEANTEREKQLQIQVLRRNELFWRGMHYSAPVLVNGLTQYMPVGDALLTKGQTPDGRQGAYDYVLNYYYGDGLKLVGILGRIPNATGVANEKLDDLEARATTVNRIKDRLWSHWNMEAMQPQLVFSLFKNGTTFAYTPFVKNGKKYGITRDPIIEMVDVELEPPSYECHECGSIAPVSTVSGNACPSCGAQFSEFDYRDAVRGPAPQVVGEIPYENGSVEFTLANAYTVTTPIEITKLDDSPWLRYEYDVFAGALMEAYSDVRLNPTKYAPGTAESSMSTETARLARAQASAVIALWYPQNSDLWRFTRYWLATETYPVITQTADKGQSERDYQQLKADYPNGLKVTLVNGHVVQMENEWLGEVWAACKPTVGEYLYPPALGDNYIRANRLVDDMANIMAQTAERAMPMTVFDPQVFDIKAMKKHAATPAEFVPALPSLGSRLRDSMWNTPTVELKDTVPQAMDAFLNAAREITGITAPLFGGDQGSQTLGEAELKRNQALMPHNTTWTFIRQFVSRAVENAVIQFAKYSGGQLSFKPSPSLPAEQVMIENIADLLKGGWHVECDEAIPLTWGQRRAQYWQMIDKGPEFWGMVGISNPDNLSATMAALGNDDITVPGVDGRAKANKTISMLMQQEPIQQPDMYGMPQLMPSIPADEFEDNHELMVQVVKEWAQKQGFDMRQTNPAGYANVIAWGRAHQQMLMAEMAPQPQPGEPTGGPPTPPGQPQDGGGLEGAPPPGSPQLNPGTPPPEELGAPTLESQPPVF